MKKILLFTAIAAILTQLLTTSCEKSSTDKINESIENYLKSDCTDYEIISSVIEDTLYISELQASIDTMNNTITYNDSLIIVWGNAIKERKVSYDNANFRIKN